MKTMLSKILKGGSFTFWISTIGPIFNAMHAPARADVLLPEIQNVSASDDCSESDIDWTLTPEGDFQIQFLDFKSFSVAAPSHSEKKCNIKVTVKPPEGYQLIISEGTLEGAYARSGDASAKVTQAYYLNKDGQNLKKFTGEWASPSGPDEEITGFTNWAGPRNATGAPNKLNVWAQKPSAACSSQCGIPVAIVGEITASTQVQNAGRSEVYLDRLLQSQNKLKWNWHLVPCFDKRELYTQMQGHWNFSYRAANGNWVKGGMNLNGEAGQYRPAGAPWSGMLSGIYADDSSLKGTWSAANSRGWFQFQSSDAGQTFQGTWGFESDNQIQGSWTGTR